MTRQLIVGLAVGLALAACTPSAPSPAQEPAAVAGGSPTTLTVAIAGEVDTLASKLGGGDTYNGEFDFMSASPLVVLNGESMPLPLLAAELPSRDAGSWIVNPDGTMATTWRIRRNAKWHDGHPVTPEDFMLTLRVYQDSNLPVSMREPERFMDRIERVDDSTLVIRWKQSYPWANRLISGQLDPLLPDHIMGTVYESSPPEAFVRHEFWQRTSYVGTGPYLVAERLPGSHITYRAWDEYFMGRPRIGQVTFRIIEDTNTVVANLLSGGADVTVGSTLGHIAGATVKEQWAPGGAGQVIITPVRFRYMEFQHNPAHNRQPALLDPRGRRAIAHGIDRDSLAEVTTAGASRGAEIFLAPNDQLYQPAIGAAAKYPFDVATAWRLLSEIGWSRGPEGTLRNPQGEPFDLEVRTTTGADNETEASIIAADLTKLGVRTSQNALSEAAQRDNEYRVTFPGVNLTARSIRVPATIGIWTTDQCPNPQQNYRGANRGCWQSREYDRLFQIASTSLDESDRARAVASALKILTEEVGILGMSYNAENIAVRKGLVGPGPRSSEQVGNTWNVYEWRWTS